MSDHQLYVVEYDNTTGTWDIYFNNFSTGYRRFISEHYDPEEAQNICAFRNSRILPRFDKLKKERKQ